MEYRAAGRVFVPDPGCHGAGQEAWAEDDLCADSVLVLRGEVAPDGDSSEYHPVYSRGASGSAVEDRWPDGRIFFAD